MWVGKYQGHARACVYMYKLGEELAQAPETTFPEFNNLALVESETLNPPSRRTVLMTHPFPPRYSHPSSNLSPDGRPVDICYTCAYGLSTGLHVFPRFSEIFQARKDFSLSMACFFIPNSKLWGGLLELKSGKWNSLLRVELVVWKCEKCIAFDRASIVVV